MRTRIAIELLMLAATLGGCSATVGGQQPATAGTVTATPPTPAPTPTPAGPGAVGVTAQVGPGSLLAGGNVANFGVLRLATGFTPDPHDVNVVSGGDIDAGTMNLGEGCRGWLTRQPDIILHLSGSSSMLRFYVTAGSEDTTLVINAADGSYHCNDDSYGGRNPSVDIANARAGQYDVWVGSYQQGVRANGVLHVTELPSRHP